VELARLSSAVRGWVEQWAGGPVQTNQLCEFQLGVIFC
jgi:hypothetical protein